ENVGLVWDLVIGKIGNQAWSAIEEHDSGPRLDHAQLIPVKRYDVCGYKILERLDRIRMNQRDVSNVGIKYRPRNNRSAALGLGDQLKTLLVHVLDNAFVPAIGFDQTIENEDRQKHCQTGYEGFEEPHAALTMAILAQTEKRSQLQEAAIHGPGGTLSTSLPFV